MCGRFTGEGQDRWSGVRSQAATPTAHCRRGPRRGTARDDARTPGGPRAVLQGGHVRRLVRLWTEDGQSRFSEEVGLLPSAPARRVHAQESPPGSALDWHDAPCRQYVITLRGTLRFTTRDGRSFLLGPGDVLLAEDTTGGGHRWELVDDQPWSRVYVEIDDQR